MTINDYYNKSKSMPQHTNVRKNRLKSQIYFLSLLYA